MTTLPFVDVDIDPERSFWLDHVHYPWPHHTARVEDARRRTWEIAYVDLYTGQDDRASARTLVLLHGRGMNCAYWGRLIDEPLAAGWRVIAVDWSHSGKSIPLNLHLTTDYSLDDSRQVLFNLIVRHLGIARADYLGHSLGGQMLAGYALRHPENVAHAVLYAPAGMELLGEIRAGGVWLNDPALAAGYPAFSAAWSAAGVLPSIGRNREDVESGFFESRRADAAPYVSRDNPLGRFIVDMRVAAMRGNAAEWERYEQCHGWDMYSSYSECSETDPDALPKRVPQLAVPTLLALGDREPVYPMWGSRNASMLRDVVDPLCRAAKKNGSPLQTKIYRNGGHFLHFDVGDEFVADVIRFCRGEAVDGLYGRC